MGIADFRTVLVTNSTAMIVLPFLELHHADDVRAASEAAIAFAKSAYPCLSAVEVLGITNAREIIASLEKAIGEVDPHPEVWPDYHPQVD